MRPTAWSGGQDPQALRLKPYLMGLRGLIPEGPLDRLPPDYYTSPPHVQFQMTAEAHRAWGQKYGPLLESITSQVVGQLQAMGYSLQLLATPQQICNPAAGCVGWQGYLYRVTTPDGCVQEATIVMPALAMSANSVDSIVRSYVDTLESSRYWACPQPSAPAAAPAPAPATATATAAPTYSRSASLSAPDGYVVGGRFVLRIQGKPGGKIEIWASQNGREHGTTPFGFADSSGRFEISGVFGPEHAGSWHEKVYVAGELAGELRFSVSSPPPPAVQQPGVVQTLSQHPQMVQGGGGSTTLPDTGEVAVSSSSSSSSSGDGEVKTAAEGSNNLLLMVLVGAGVLALFLGGKK